VGQGRARHPVGLELGGEVRRLADNSRGCGGKEKSRKEHFSGGIPEGKKDISYAEPRAPNLREQSHKMNQAATESFQVRGGRAERARLRTVPGDVLNNSSRAAVPSCLTDSPSSNSTCKRSRRKPSYGVEGQKKGYDC